MKYSRLPFAVLILGMVVAATASLVIAHPPTALVMDSRGNVYFSDLSSVRVLRPDGTTEIAVPQVHTHELWLAPGDTLYGEDVRNVGDDYRHRVWKLAPDGALSDVIPWRSGFPDDYHDYGFNRDSVGLTYLLRRSERLVEVLDAAGDPVRTISLAGFEGFVHWLTVSPDGTVYISVGADLLTVPPGDTEATLVESGLVERTEQFDWVHDRHALMGMWPDSAGNIYVSVFSGQVLKRVSPGGETSIAARSPDDWSPVGGMVSADGSLWILEWSGSNEARVRRLDSDGTERIFTPG
jgi:streptogramin lyase